MQRERQNMVTFRNIPISVLNEMAKYLDTYGDASWKHLAELQDLQYLDIIVIN